MLFYNPTPRVNIFPFNINMGETFLFADFDKAQFFFFLNTHEKKLQILFFFICKINQVLTAKESKTDSSFTKT